MIRLATAVSMALAAGLLLALSSAPARAQEGLQLSPDGDRWGPTLDRPLFDPAVRWVPGDERTASFWVRNATDRPADLSLAILTEDTDELLADDVLTVVARAHRPGDDACAVTLADAGSAYPLGPVASRKAVRITLIASYGAEAGNATQQDRAGLDFRVTLTDHAAGGPTTPPSSPSASRTPDGPGNTSPAEPDGPTPTPGGPDLPGTGGPSWWWLAVGGASAAAGITLLRLIRSQRGGAHD